MAMLRFARTLALHFMIVSVGTAGLFGQATAAEPAAAGKPAAAPRALMRLPAWIESIGGRADRKPDASAGQRRSIPSVPMLTAGWKELVDGEAAQAGEAPASEESAAEPTPPGRKLGPESSVLKSEEAGRVADVPAAPTGSLQSESTQDADVPSKLTTTVPADGDGATKESGVDLAPPVPTAPTDGPTLAIDAASFRGANPGKTTREEVEAAWGAGESFTREDGTTGIFWKFEPFERVDVTFGDGVVESIRITLAEPVAVGQLAEQMEIADLRTVSLLDEAGVSIGEIYPERGVIVSVKPGTQSAVALILEPLDPETFVLRAEGEIEESASYAIVDLQYAIEIDPNHVRAHRLLLALLSEQGRWQESLAVAEAAEKLEPADIWTRLKHATVLLALGQTEEARAKVEAVKSQKDVPPLVVAQAARLLGRIELATKAPDFQKSVGHFEEAIRKSAPLLAHQSTQIQKAARDLLLDAHLGTAFAIAKGTWQQKGRVIPKWIDRSVALVEEVKPADPDRDRMELELCRGALAVMAGSADAGEPLPWVKRLIKIGEKLDEQVKDPSRRRQIDWDLGLALSDALTASLNRGDSSDMLDNATLTAAYLERGAERRQLTDTERRQFGDLLFRIGILHSLQKGDHATAVTWFDKVIPQWDDNPSFRESGDIGRMGESLVSMGISYWQVDRRDVAMKLSRKGIDLMVEAVDLKQLDERSLAVAYGNLSTMCAEQGDEEQSRNYAEMASRAEAGSTLR